ncbi:unnamed protein product [Fusarium graminearum]|uniref:Chromosome 2, complete genome n=1 Tax=Gibberella zeae (strain ATCC MYA-4620 / CBS 123657 / FGSC 9075 / NRRL 31084 / PH-1) TaxID=229533 RepID=A0A098DCR8_GIBZE|nr:unnamed protein product [Fusarium graminearum]CZS80035.1 unnamed protein product [Fusarium graminearum]
MWEKCKDSFIDLKSQDPLFPVKFRTGELYDMIKGNPTLPTSVLSTIRVIIAAGQVFRSHVAILLSLYLHQ